tara:strand:+ start:20926 stop:21507 length:582 start_codon:yes stop_codon:yes gene_type:complete
MSFTTEIKKLWKNPRLCMILGIVVLLGLFVFIYNSDKGTSTAKMTNQKHVNVDDQYPGETAPSAPKSPGVMPAMPAGLNSGPGAADGIRTVTGGVPQSCLNQQAANPSDLLPNDPNRNFAANTPQGSGELANVNLLKAGQLSGIDTVGGTLRNANLQLRSEPPNPRHQVSPWLNSTIEPDLMRVPLELGCGNQ